MTSLVEARLPTLAEIEAATELVYQFMHSTPLYRWPLQIADGMACRKPDVEALTTMLENVDHMVRVNDDEVEASMRFMFTDTRNVVEGVGAAALAAALKESNQLKGKRVGIVASGSNVDQEVFARVLQARK